MVSGDAGETMLALFEGSPETDGGITTYEYDAVAAKLGPTRA